MDWDTGSVYLSLDVDFIHSDINIRSHKRYVL